MALKTSGPRIPDPLRGVVVVAGGGGFVGGHLVAALRARGAEVRSVDLKPLEQWHQVFDDVENIVADLRLKEQCDRVTAGASTVYQLAADMGGMGFIEHNRALCMLSVLIDTHMLEAARHAGVSRFFYSSSACVYNTDKQRSPAVVPLREEDAYPALPEDGYGWENSFPSGCAGISWRISAWKRGSPVITTCMVLWEAGMGAGRKHPPPSAGR